VKRVTPTIYIYICVCVCAVVMSVNIQYLLQSTYDRKCLNNGMPIFVFIYDEIFIQDSLFKASATCEGLGNCSLRNLNVSETGSRHTFSSPLCLSH
jgi:hypothetical protein